MIAGGMDVKVSEVHGISQRGGSVVTYVKAGESVASPVIEKGEADLILAFEQLEAARWLPYLKKGGKIVVNTQKMDPMPVITGAAVYPERILEKIMERDAVVTPVDALHLAVEAASAKALSLLHISRTRIEHFLQSISRRASAAIPIFCICLLYTSRGVEETALRANFTGGFPPQGSP